MPRPPLPLGLSAWGAATALKTLSHHVTESYAPGASLRSTLDPRRGHARTGSAVLHPLGRRRVAGVVCEAGLAQGDTIVATPILAPTYMPSRLPPRSRV